jgi:hypothetical protein
MPKSLWSAESNGWPRTVGGLQAVWRGSGTAVARARPPSARWQYQSLVSLAYGVMIRMQHEPKSTTRVASPSMLMTRPRPYLSWVT